MKSLRFGFVWAGAGVFSAVVGLAPNINSPVSADTGDTPATLSVPEPSSLQQQFTGSASCRECHSRFFKLWRSSHHGTAMQPYTADFAREQLTAQQSEIRIGEHGYQAKVSSDRGWVVERGPEGEKKLPIAHVLGGKNVYYFLTPMAKGRLQTLPVAYDVRKKKWFDTAGSGIRHFPGLTDTEPMHWRESPYTFNTSCHSCHVSQLATNYDLETDTYRTTWAEPGINCETCHGPAEAHVRICRAAPKDRPPEDLKIIITKKFNEQQTNDLCAPCHAKMNSLTSSFKPGERYFDHYGLTTLEHPDFYPDGRDLGENYTYTLWRMSSCAKSGQLDCNHCHSPSGRFRQKDNPDQSCLPCHRERVENVVAHSHHPVDSEGSRCIACHMPTTEFARMRRSDHSMLPPTPATTIDFKSPNACNLCHTDQEAAWADKYVRQWHSDDYQAPVLHRAGLIDAARKRDWSRLPEMLAYIKGKNRDEIVATSLIRLLRACDDARIRPVLLVALKDPSPLVRSAAVNTLSDHLDGEVAAALIETTRDEFRLVRVRAAAALAAFPVRMLKEADRNALEGAVVEFMAAMKARPDDSLSHYNLGNFYTNRREHERAIACFETAARLDATNIAPLVNASLAHSAMGRNFQAEASLQRALAIDGTSVAANINLGMLLGEMGRTREAEGAFRTALKADPKSAVAAYNLGVILARDRIEGALSLCRQAAELRPDQPKYAYTLAFYLRQSGRMAEATNTLRAMLVRHPAHLDGLLLLGGTLERQGRIEEAVEVYRRTIGNEQIPAEVQAQLTARIQVLSSP